MSTVWLSQIQVQMIRIGIPICIGIGNLDCILGLFVFLQKPMRNNPCIIFLIGYMLTNLVYINITVLSVLPSGYGSDFSIKSAALCRFRMYTSFVFSAIPSYLLVMASMDRMFISPSNVRIRDRSNRHFALLMIIGICLFWMIFHLHAIFYSEIQVTYGVRLSCTTQFGDLSTFVSYYALINAVIPITFGIKTLININQVHGPHMRSKDRRLIILLIIQLSIYIFLRLPTSLYLVYGQITKYSIKTSNRTVRLFCQFVRVSIAPLMNLVTKSFRIELIRAFSKLVRLIHRRGEINVALNLTRNVNTLQMREMTAPFHNTNMITPVK